VTNTRSTIQSNAVCRMTTGYSASYLLGFFLLTSLAPIAGVTAEPHWELPASSRWFGNTAEQQTSYCQEKSFRWDVPFQNFDINKDGKLDFLMPISCYQGTATGDEQHNLAVWGAWRLYCSTPDDTHEDCTKQIFGTDEIQPTGAEGGGDPWVEGGGGNPYTHVAQQPRDLNGDGYPEIWYAINRDDGRRGFNYAVPEDLVKLDELCGDPVEENLFDCTRASKQSILMSNSDGTYEVKFLPWMPYNTQALLALPNTVGTFDLWALIYGENRVGRLIDGEFVEVTAEYQADSDWNYVQYGNPYAQAFEFDGKTYVAHADIHPDIAAPLPSGISSQGFTLWLFEPGQGFTLADTYSPDLSEVFSYQLRLGDSVETRYGAYQGSQPVFDPRWHFFYQLALDDSSEPTLVVQTESFGQLGDNFHAEPDSDLIYEQGDGNVANNDANLIWGGTNTWKGFYIRDGKLIERDQSVVAGDLIFNVSKVTVLDLNDDGYDDAIGHTGADTNPVVLINNGSGTLEQRFLGDHWPDLRDDQRYWSRSDWLTYGVGSSLSPLYASDTLDLIYWTQGFAMNIPDYMGSDFSYEAGDIVILRGTQKADTYPVYTTRRQQRDIEYCLTTYGWLWYWGGSCSSRQGLPSEPPTAPAITAVEAGDGELYLRLSPGSDDGFDATSYTVRCQDANGSVVEASASSPVVTVTGLENGQSYECVAGMTTGVGSSGFSTITMTGTPEEQASGLPIWLLYEASKP
jgi:hypothetical protein